MKYKGKEIEYLAYYDGYFFLCELFIDKKTKKVLAYQTETEGFKSDNIEEYLKLAKLNKALKEMERIDKWIKAIEDEVEYKDEDKKIYNILKEENPSLFAVMDCFKEWYNENIRTNDREKIFNNFSQNKTGELLIEKIDGCYTRFWNAVCDTATDIRNEEDKK